MRGPGGAEAGMTLIEMMVAMALLALLSMGLYGGLSLGTNAWRRGIAHNAGDDSVRFLQSFLRREIEQAYPAYLAQDAAHPQIDFSGGADQLEFLAPAPEALIGGGDARLSLSTEPGIGGMQLILVARPEMADENASLARETLLTGVRSVQFAYFGPDEAGGGAQWRENWAGRTTLPQLVRLRVAFPPDDPRIWPELVLAPRIAVDVSCIYDPLTRYCRGR